VRIALYLKDIPFEPVAIDLRNTSHKQDTYISENPQGLVPLIIAQDENTHTPIKIAQSLVILNYLEEHYPTPPLVPNDHHLKLKVQSLAQYMACEIHPLNNLRVLKYLEGTLQISNEQKQQWYFHWLKEGFDVLEKELAFYKTAYSVTDHPTLIDLCLIPQMYNAHRFKFDLSGYPRLLEIEKNCLKLDAFQKASPEAQPDCDL